MLRFQCLPRNFVDRNCRGTFSIESSQKLQVLSGGTGTQSRYGAGSGDGTWLIGLNAQIKRTPKRSPNYVAATRVTGASY